MKFSQMLKIKIDFKRIIFALTVIFALAAVGASHAEQSAAIQPATIQEQDLGNVDNNEDIGEVLQTINFNKDVNTTDALRFLGVKYRKNIVPSQKVGGMITVTRLEEVTFDEAMEAILGHNLKYEYAGNLVKVYTAEEYGKIKADKSRMIHKVFTLYYISAAEAKKLISPILSDSGIIEATMAAETGVPTSETISAQTGGGDATAMNDTIVIHDFPENIAKVEEIINLLDIRPKQVLIEAAILSATLTEDMQFGIDWNTLKGTAISGLTGITQGAPHYFKSAGTSAKVESALTGGMTVGLAIDDIAAFIRAVEEVTDVTLLANPKILTVNKQLGQVYIGNKLGYREGSVETAAGGTQEGAVKFLDTGVKLSFRPYIGNDGYIRMDIHPKDSSGSVPSGIPQETSAELVTNIIVKDGQTIVIGGLFRDKITNVKTQVPLLGDLPILGALFKGTADQTERQEVIVLLTPYIIEEPSEAQGQTGAEDIARKRLGAKDELQWINRARIAENHYANAAKHYIAGDNVASMQQVKAALELRPTYLEALRLKEKITKETSPEDAASIERVTLETIEQDLDEWMRK